MKLYAMYDLHCIMFIHRPVCCTLKCQCPICSNSVTFSPSRRICKKCWRACIDYVARFLYWYKSLTLFCVKMEDDLGGRSWNTYPITGTVRKRDGRSIVECDQLQFSYYVHCLTRTFVVWSDSCHAPLSWFVKWTLDHNLRMRILKGYSRFPDVSKN